jgi:hypothetical protein
MKPSLHSLIVGGTALASLAFSGSTFAQPIPPQPSAAPAAAPPPAPVPGTGGPLYDLQQLPAIKGTVSRFTLTPRGELDGFLLADGTQVHLPPHLSAELAAALRPGDPFAVRAHGGCC